jgi:hypothetical protein
MIFSTFITIIFVLMAAYALVLWSYSLWGRVLVLGYAVALVIVWLPDFATKTANYVGVKSGVNLVFMVMILVLLNGLIYMGRHLYLANRKLTLLTRHVALMQAPEPGSATAGVAHSTQNSQSIEHSTSNDLNDTGPG